MACAATFPRRRAPSVLPGLGRPGRRLSRACVEPSCSEWDTAEKGRWRPRRYVLPTVLAWLLPDRLLALAALRRPAARGRPDVVGRRLRRSVADRLSAPAQRPPPDDRERRPRAHRPARGDDRVPIGGSGRLDLRPRLRGR